jgi:hypothetical protein
METGRGVASILFINPIWKLMNYSVTVIAYEVTAIVKKALEAQREAEKKH